MKISPKCVCPQVVSSVATAGPVRSYRVRVVPPAAARQLHVTTQLQQQPAASSRHPSMFSITRLVASSLACVWWHPIQFAVVVVSV